MSLGVIIASRAYFGPAFDDYGWRVPFLVSFLLVAVAIWIRLQLQETPIFQEIRAKGQMTQNPWKEAFLSSNFKFVAIATVIVIGEAVMHLAPETRDAAPEIPWTDIAGLRDLIAHEYFRIDIHRVLEIVERDLLPLEKAVDRLA